MKLINGINRYLIFITTLLLSNHSLAQNLTLVCNGRTEEVRWGSNTAYKSDTRTYKFIDGKLDGVYRFYFDSTSISMAGDDPANENHPYKTLWGISIDRVAGSVREIWVSKDQKYMNEFTGTCNSVSKPKF